MSQQIGRAGSRTGAWILLAFGIVACIIGVVFIPHHHLRATASFIVGVLALVVAVFLLRRKPDIE